MMKHKKAKREIYRRLDNLEYWKDENLQSHCTASEAMQSLLSYVNAVRKRLKRLERKVR